MESYSNFVNDNGNAKSQIVTGKNPMPTSGVQVFETQSSKVDLYDHMKTNLQVSETLIILTFLQYYMPPYEQFTKDFAKLVF